MAGQGLGDLEQLVLMAVIRLSRDAYAVSVRNEIEAQTGRAVSRGAVYVTLDRLARKGYLVSHMGEPTAQRGGKAKRLFTIAAPGVVALQASLAGIQQMVRGIERHVAWKPTT